MYDRTEEQKQAVVRLVESLEQAGSVKDIDYTGTTWRTVFSTSTSESAGKLGPFIGRVRQVTSTSPGAYTARLSIAASRIPCLLKPQHSACLVAVF